MRQLSLSQMVATHSLLSGPARAARTKQAITTWLWVTGEGRLYSETLTDSNYGADLDQ